MPVDLNFSLFPLISEAAKNEQSRPGTIMLEYFQASVNFSTNEGQVEVPTQMEEVLGLLDLNFKETAGDITDTLALHTDGVITTGAVTVDVFGSDVANDSTLTIRGFLVGYTKAVTELLNSPV